MDRTPIDLITSKLPLTAPDEELLALDDALTDLAKEDALRGRLVKLRFFAGLSIRRGRGSPWNLDQHGRSVSGRMPERGFSRPFVTNDDE